MPVILNSENSKTSSVVSEIKQKIQLLLMHSFLGTFSKLQKAAISFVLSVCLLIRPYACKYSAPTGWIFMKFDI
jgi:hypothetical protein